MNNKKIQFDNVVLSIGNMSDELKSIQVAKSNPDYYKSRLFEDGEITFKVKDINEIKKLDPGDAEKFWDIIYSVESIISSLIYGEYIEALINFDCYEDITKTIYELQNIVNGVIVLLQKGNDELNKHRKYKDSFMRGDWLKERYNGTK